MKKPLAHRLQAEINDLQRQLRKHQDKRCKHPRATAVHEANTGNWDPHDDKYWISLFCPTCLKRWRLYSTDPEYRETLNKVTVVKSHNEVRIG